MARYRIILLNFGMRYGWVFLEGQQSGRHRVGIKGGRGAAGDYGSRRALEPDCAEEV